jgi:hypothetical protein
MEGKQDKVDTVGRVALVCIKTVKGKLDKLYFSRNSNPLNMMRTDIGIGLSSEGPGDPIAVDKLYTFNYELKRLTSRNFKMREWAAYKGYTDSNYNTDSATDYHWSGRDNPIPYRNTITDAIVDSNMGGPIANWFHQQKFLETDYDRDGNPIKAYDSCSTFDDEYERGLTEEAEEFMETYSPSVNEVQKKAMEYLSANLGNFDNAYLEIEADYIDLFELGEDEWTLKEIKLMERAMSFILRDPEYVNEQSVSSMWQEVGQWVS